MRFIQIAICCLLSGGSLSGGFFAQAPALAPAPKSTLTVSSLFSDHMVLQQKAAVNFWGHASPGEKLSIRTSWGKKAATITDAHGNWKVKLKTPAAGGPYTIELKGSDTTFMIDDVLIGEVWLAAGQSNMDIPLKGWPPGDTIAGSKQEIESAQYPEIRFMKVPFAISVTPIDSMRAKWKPLSPATAGGVSATAYFYARKLWRELHVPVGIIQSSIGGTPAEAWTSKDYLSKLEDFDFSIADLSLNPGSDKLNSNTPTVLFNAMIFPLIPYTIKGIIWYQGESNVGRAEQYSRLFPLLIEDWRNKWGADLPFYYVQLAPFLYSAYDQRGQSPKLRDAQRYALRLRRTGMVTTLDIGYLKTAHPPYKLEVGDRLAGFALANQYGRGGVVSGPLFKKAISSGNEIVVHFGSVGSGLVTGADGLYNFEVAGADRRYVPGTAVISHNRVRVSAPGVVRPVFVRYAWTDSSRASLFNRNGLPAATFSSEKF